MAGMRYQPQGLIRLNRSNPLTRGLVAAYVPRSGPRDATGTLATLVDVAPVASPLGYVTPPLLGAPYPAVGTFPFTRTDAISAFVFGRFAVSSDSFATPLISVGQAGGSNGWKFGPLGNGGNLDLTFANVADYATTVPFPAIGSIAFSATPGANARIFTNGGFRQQIAIGTPNSTLANARMVIGQRGDGQVDSNSASQVALALYWNRALSDAEQASLAANPWQVFDAQEDEEYILGVGSNLSYTHTPSGGITTGGVNAVVRSKRSSARGGVAFTGASSSNNARNVQASGGFSTGGSGTRVRGITRIGAGGISLAGSASYGSFQLSNALSLISSGGVVYRGAAGVAKAATGLTVRGGLSLTGSATIQRRVAGSYGIVEGAFNDVIYQKLKLMGYVGSLEDMLDENMYWRAITGDQPRVPLNDVKRKALVDLGYSGELNEMEKKYWSER